MTAVLLHNTEMNDFDFGGFVLGAVAERGGGRVGVTSGWRQDGVIVQQRRRVLVVWLQVQLRLR